MKRFLAAAFLILASCNEASEPASDESPAEEEAAAIPGSTVESLEGEWRVAGLDGEALDLPMALTVTGGAQVLDWQPDCSQLMHRYWIGGTGFRAARIRNFVTEEAMEAVGPSLFPPPCLIALPPKLDEVLMVVEIADTIERTEQNGIRISGKGRSVTLFSQ